LVYRKYRKLEITGLRDNPESESRGFGVKKSGIGFGWKNGYSTPLLMHINEMLRHSDGSVGWLITFKWSHMCGSKLAEGWVRA
jgi:hypothetical protein